MRLKGIYKKNSIQLSNPHDKELGIKNGTPVSLDIKLKNDYIETRIYQLHG